MNIRNIIILILIVRAISPSLNGQFIRDH